MQVLAWGTTTATADRPATDVDLVEVSSGSLTLRVLTLGAAIAGLECPDRTGRPGPVHLSLATLADYEDRARNPHLGASIGRYANRIAGASFPMGGRQVELVANNGRNQLHGGPVGFDRHVWELVEATSGSEGGEVHLRLVSADGDQGFPGTVTADASFAVSGDTLQITYRATTDASTVVNMTNHGYWNLDGSTTVRDHHIQLAADRVLPVDGDGIPTGALHAVGDTPFDLRARTELGPAMDGAGGGFDHCFAVRGAPATHGPRSGHAASGRRGRRAGDRAVDVGRDRPARCAALHRQRTRRALPSPRLGLARDPAVPRHPEPSRARVRAPRAGPGLPQRHRAPVRHGRTARGGRPRRPRARRPEDPRSAP